MISARNFANYGIEITEIQGQKSDRPYPPPSPLKDSGIFDKGEGIMWSKPGALVTHVRGCT